MVAFGLVTVHALLTLSCSFSAKSWEPSLSSIWKYLYYNLLGVHTYMVLGCLSIKLTINMLDENINYVDFQFQFVWEHFRV